MTAAFHGAFFRRLGHSAPYLWEDKLNRHDQVVGRATQRVAPQHKIAPCKRKGDIESVHHAIEQSGTGNAWIFGIEINEQFDFDDALRKGGLTPGVCFLPALEKKASGPARRGNVAPKLEAPRRPKRPGYALATIFISAPMALSRGVTAIRLPLS
jgi:hypothetical protein